MKKYCSIFVIVFYMLTVGGCASLADARAAKGTGPFKVYQHDIDIVWAAIVNIINESDLDLITENKSKGEILAQRSMTVFSYGENVAIYIEIITDKESTRVEINSTKALATNITAKSWDSYIFQELDNKL
jgi:hypothetical protein